MNGRPQQKAIRCSNLHSPLTLIETTSDGSNLLIEVVTSASLLVTSALLVVTRTLVETISFLKGRRARPQHLTELRRANAPVLLVARRICLSGAFRGGIRDGLGR